MLINQKTGFVQTSVPLEASEYKFKASAKAFDIFSNLIYQHKVRAIIRELSCNAVDAHISAGTIDKPFDIHLPTFLEPEFKIRDFGTGISPEDIEEIYKTYFESTKTNSNDQIGCLGLGSKTPFCYTDNFQITSYFNGKKYMYASYLTDEGKPATSFIGQEDTTEHNGLEISFAVNKKDFPQFLEEARRVFKWFKHKPNILGQFVEIPTIEKVLQGKNWYIENLQGYLDRSELERPLIIMGNVAYPLSSENFAEYERFFKTPIRLVVNIGDVDVAASREALSLNKRTISFLKLRFKEIHQELLNSIQEEINKKESYWDAACYINNNSKGHIFALLIIPNNYQSLHCNFNYKSRPLINSIKEFEKKIYYYISHNYRTRKEATFKSTCYDGLSISKSCAFILDDDKLFSEAKLRKWLLRNGKFKSAIVISKEDLSILNDLEVPNDQILEQKDIILKSSSRIGQGFGRKGKKKNTVYVFKNGSIDGKEDIDFSTVEGFYVETFNKKIVFNHVEISKNVFDTFEEVTKIQLEEKFYGLTKNQIKALPEYKNKKFINLLEFMKIEAEKIDYGPFFMEEERRIKNDLKFSSRLNVLSNNKIITNILPKLSQDNKFYKFFQDYLNEIKIDRDDYLLVNFTKYTLLRLNKEKCNEIFSKVKELQNEIMKDFTARENEIIEENAIVSLLAGIENPKLLDYVRKELEEKV